jgi:hypothetical protein
MTKDKILDDLLIKLYKKFKSENAEFKLDIKINYKDFRKYFLNYRKGKKSHEITKEIVHAIKEIK